MRPEVYILLDACLLAGYYAEQTLSDKYPQAANRIVTLVESVRKGCSPHIRLVTPEVCVAEAQTVLSKHALTGWTNKRKRDNKKAIHGRSYLTLKAAMRADLHGARIIESIPLQRYHVLARHLVMTVDHSLRLLKEGKASPVNALGSMDQLIAGVSIWLHRFLGEGRLVVVTTDYRLVKVLEKCRTLKETQATRLGLLEAAADIGIEWSPSLYPEPIHLETATETKLRQVVGSWPLPLKVAKAGARPRKAVTEKDIDELVKLYKALGMGRDRLPYTTAMTTLTTDFNRATGHTLTEAQVWARLLNRLKQGSKETAA